MFEELNEIKLSEQSFPIKCDLVVLEKIQNKYGSIDVFEDGIRVWVPSSGEDRKESEEKTNKKKAGKEPEEKKKPKMKMVMPKAECVMDALFWMAKEGAEISGKDFAYTREEISRMVDMPIWSIATILHAEFLECFVSKNQMTTQSQE